jgi:citrate synthase
MNKIKLTDKQGKEHDISVIADQYIAGKDLKKAGVTYQYMLIITYHRVLDPGYTNTAVIRSTISYIDGDRGVLEYRGYKIEDLAAKSNFLEVAFLLIYGHLPTRKEYVMWRERVMKHTFVHVRMSTLMSSFNYDAHPMGMFIRYHDWIANSF